MKILQPAERVVTESYSRAYWDAKGRVRCRWDCDALGVIDEANLHPVQVQQLQGCRDGSLGLDPTIPAVCRDVHVFHRPAVGACVRCDREVTLGGFTNTCECGADYNWGGQLLASRSQWGEETGESLEDILNIP